MSGVWKALAAAVLFGLSTPLAKGLLGSTSPQVLAGLFYLSSGIGLRLMGLVPRLRPFLRAEAPLRREDQPWLAGAVVFGGILGPLLLLVGLQRTTGSAASLLLNLEGVFTALLAWFVFKENVDRRIALGMALIVAGGTVLSWQGGPEWGELAGPLAVGAACLCWAIDNNLTQKVSAGDPVQIAAIKGLVAGSVNVGIALALGAAPPPPSLVAGAAAVGFACFRVSLMLYVLGLRELGTARTGAYFSFAPFVGAVASLLLWREPVTPSLVAAGALMAAGLWLHLTERHDHWHVHEPLEHVHRHVHDEHHRHEHAPDDPTGEPHTHLHRHELLAHRHAHFPDIHHRHPH
ncbi:DMT family transporter [Carboxydochorda subterranea]|uniref:DMT family transporter n=1 Tax=Carboxydichorda subterranea TaxID=3109565 RepID=A0ABZ1C0R0_9FIRM|nr:DMT family transporter [Limnochorda sp. L945t]WRP18684.1 DMT family transporter [Limnochorda sp. L945t]